MPFVTNSDYPTSVKATLTTLLVVVCPKIFLIGAIAILGKPGFAYIKGVVMNFFRKVGPPAEVGKWRYRVGLVMFFLPFLTSWILTYFGHVLPGGREATPAYLKGGDVMQILSLFVLGGDFWDKLRSLFIRQAKAVFPEKGATRDLAIQDLGLGAGRAFASSIHWPLGSCGSAQTICFDGALERFGVVVDTQAAAVPAVGADEHFQ